MRWCPGDILAYKYVIGKIDVILLHCNRSRIKEAVGKASLFIWFGPNMTFVRTEVPENKYFLQVAWPRNGDSVLGAL